MTAKKRSGTMLYAGSGIFAVLMLGGLGACTMSPPVYGPKTADSTNGYADQQLAQNRYRVTYTGTVATPRDTVENFLLFRAAQVTQNAGFPAFVFDTRDTKAHTTYLTDFDGPLGFGPRRYGWYWHNWPLDDETQSRPITRYEAYAEIVMLTADQAKTEPRALGVRDVMEHLGPKVMPPPPPVADH